MLKKILDKALAAAGEDPITVYNFTKHSGFTQLAIEHGLNDHELQLAGGHADIRSVRKYRKLSMKARRSYLEGRPGQAA